MPTDNNLITMTNGNDGADSRVPKNQNPLGEAHVMSPVNTSEHQTGRNINLMPPSSLTPPVHFEKQNMVNDYTRQATRKVPDITSEYEIKGLIRRGHTGEVRECIHKQTK